MLQDDDLMIKTKAFMVYLALAWFAAVLLHTWTNFDI
jgi:hypothetical protein